MYIFSGGFRCSQHSQIIKIGKISTEIGITLAKIGEIGIIRRCYKICWIRTWFWILLHICFVLKHFAPLNAIETRGEFQIFHYHPIFFMILWFIAKRYFNPLSVGYKIWRHVYVLYVRKQNLAGRLGKGQPHFGLSGT